MAAVLPLVRATDASGREGLGRFRAMNSFFDACEHELRGNVRKEDDQRHERGALRQTLRVQIGDEQRKRHVERRSEERHREMVTMQFTKK